MAWGSSTPAAIENLLAAIGAVKDAETGLRDGPRVVADGINEAITVGYVDDTDETAVTGSMEYEGLAVAPLRETYSIRCAASVRNGAKDITAARSRAYELLAAVGGALAADKTLGGVVLSARIGDMTLSQDQTSRGADVVLAFNVDCDAYTTR